MRKHLLAAGLAVAALIPSFAFAQVTCEQQSSNQAVGTLAGAGLGALAGSAIAGGRDRTTGAVLGGITGAIIGNQVTRGAADCTHAYGYYDSNSAWHATRVSRDQAQGYYDREGHWVVGAPNGYYDGQGRWISGNNGAVGGYYDNDNRWVPASSAGYYADNGQWVEGAASGYYRNGRWISGPATGHYDANGNWMAGQAAGHRNANGVWVADAQPGYYDSNGRWNAGSVMGYYDAQGRWIRTTDMAGYETYTQTTTTYSQPSNLNVSFDFQARVDRLDQRIQRGITDGSLQGRAAYRAQRELNSIRRDESRMSHRDGELNQRDEDRIVARLDALGSSLRMARDENRSGNNNNNYNRNN